jgi:hypothetical protein
MTGLRIGALVRMAFGAFVEVVHFWRPRTAFLAMRRDPGHHGGMTECRAKVRWLSFEQGGRAKPPTGPRYTSTARFGKEAERAGAEPWALVIYIGEDPANVTVSPLVDAVPPELFERGSRFDLFEGDTKVGEGEIV